MRHRGQDAAPQRVVACLAAIVALTSLSCVALAQQPQPWPRQFTLRDADGDGHPVFGNPTIVAYPLEEGRIPQATSVVFGDLNGNGSNDAVITNTTQRTGTNPVAAVTILLNKGDGIFVHGEVYHSVQETTHADLADLDGDRVLDIAVANGGGGTVSVMRGRGDGTFEAAVDYAVGGNARCVRAVDIDGDGHIDLAVMVTSTREIVTLRNRGDGTFEPWRRLSVPGMTGLYFGAPCPGPFFVAGDLDGDRLPDVVVPTGPSVRVLMNRGGGEFAPPVAYAAQVTGGGAYGVALADLDRNGSLDLAVALVGWPSKYLSLLKNDGTGRFGAPVEYDMATRPNVPGGLYDPLTVTLADITGNGYPDVCVGNVSNPNVAVRHNNGDGTFGERILYDVGTHALYFTQFADLSGDGRDDLAVLNYFGRSKMVVLLNRGDGTLLTHEGVPKEYEVLGGPYPWIQPMSVIAVDVDRDGDKDLVVAVSGIVSRQSNVLIVHNDNGRFERWTPYDLGPPGTSSAAHVASGDLNDNGWPDLVVADPVTTSGWRDPGSVWVLLNNRDGTFASPVRHRLDGVYPLRVAVGDLNGNGFQDIAALVSEFHPGNDVTPIDRRILILWNDGKGNFTIGPSHTIWTAPWFSVGDLVVRDFDGDRILDIAAVVSHRDGPGVFAFLRGIGGGGFDPVVQHPVAQGWALAAPVLGAGPEVWVASGPQAPPTIHPFLTTFDHATGSIFERTREYRDAGVSAQGIMFRDVATTRGGHSAMVALLNRASDMLAVAHAGPHGVVEPWHHYGIPLIPHLGVWTTLNPESPTFHVVTTGAASRNLSILAQHSLPLPGCYPDCTKATGRGVLDIFDFLCFLNAFNANDPYACDCDLSTGVGVCDAFDFTCFLNAFANGCG